MATRTTSIRLSIAGGAVVAFGFLLVVAVNTPKTSVKPAASQPASQPTTRPASQPATRPAVVAPPLPRVPDELRAHCNLDALLVGIADRWAHVGLCTDLAAPAAQPELYAQARAAYLQRNPAAVIGTYLSGSDVAPAAELRHFPREMLPPDGFAPAALLPTVYGGQRRTVDLRDSAAAERFAALFALELAGRPEAACVMVDNLVAHPSVWRDGPAWSLTIAQLRRLRDICHASVGASGVARLCFANAAFHPATIPADDLSLLAGACDGVLLEMPWHRSARTVPGTLATIAALRVLPRAVLIPIVDESALVTSDEKFAAREHEAALLAAVAFMAGPRVSVSTAAFRPPQAFEKLPTLLGRPIGEPEVFETGLQQHCERGLLLLDLAAMSVWTVETVPETQ